MKKTVIVLMSMVLFFSALNFIGCTSIDERQEMGHDHCAE